jgi:glycogen phosphorylase
MNPVGHFKFTPALPPAVEELRRVAYNLRWAWDHESIELFRRLDSDLWEATGHNAVLMLGSIDQLKLDAASRDDAFLAHLDRVARDLDTYLAAKTTWYRRIHGGPDGMLVGYFSAEFGVTECLSIFAGGLGILAGDHLKAASDMGVPVIGVGLLYQQGYFRQYLNAAGWQQEAYEDNDLHNLPVQPVKNTAGDPITIHLDLPGRTLRIGLWSAEVGRRKLYLLDTNVPGNLPADRDITDQLYGGDLDVRIRQEIVLGLGGYRALQALGLHPTVYHMNEGHSAFLALEHIRYLMESCGLTFDEARHAASASFVFTTHTPVPAGHDYFPPELIHTYFNDYSRNLGIEWREFMSLGRQNPDDHREPFCMTVLALKLAAASNAVSRLHGQVSRRMWRGLWPDVPDGERPIGYVTNGVHFRSWVSYEMNQLYDRYLGPRWREEPANPQLWERVESVPAEELWRTHERRRERLVAFARSSLASVCERSYSSEVCLRGRLRPPKRHSIRKH